MRRADWSAARSPKPGNTRMTAATSPAKAASATNRLVKTRSSRRVLRHHQRASAPCGHRDSHLAYALVPRQSSSREHVVHVAALPTGHFDRDSDPETRTGVHEIDAIGIFTTPNA